MTNTVATTTVTGISLSKLVPSPANARRTGAGLGIEALAASIGAHGLLQSLVVRPKLDGDGKPTGKFEVAAGGRRLAALKLLAKRKHIGKGAAIPCRVLDGDGVDGAEASLAENVVRQDMHPADQFEAFARLHRGGAGLGIEDIAARFGVSAHTVRQRLRLAVVSPVLVQAYRDGALTLDHLTAFAVTEDQAAQERVHGQLQDWQRHPDAIRRLLTNGLVPASDRRVTFAGLDAYTAAGGRVQRDLFSEDGGGWIANAGLLERLVAERMEREAEQVRGEGWRWVAIGPDAQARAWPCRRVWPCKMAPSPEDEARRTELASRYDELAVEHNGSADDLPEDVAAELDSIEAELATLEVREDVWTPAEVAVAGAVLTLALDGSLRVERGFVRPEDEPKPEPASPAVDGDGQDGAAADGTGSIGEGSDSGDAPAGGDGGSTSIGGAWPLPVRGGAAVVAEPEDKAPALSATLQAELEAHRTAGLQAELAGQPELALRVMLHALATDAFYARYADTVARFTSYPPNLASACPGIADSPARQALAQAEADWRGRLPEMQPGLWAWLGEQDTPALLSLLAMCVARTADAGRADWTKAHGAIQAQVASAAGLDMRGCWTATVEGYLGRVPKALILDAVREGAGASAAACLASTKEVMAADAAALLAGTGWLPPVLHVPGVTYPVDSSGSGNQGQDAASVAMAAE